MVNKERRCCHPLPPGYHGPSWSAMADQFLNDQSGSQGVINRLTCIILSFPSLPPLVAMVSGIVSPFLAWLDLDSSPWKIMNYERKSKNNELDLESFKTNMESRSSHFSNAIEKVNMNNWYKRNKEESSEDGGKPSAIFEITLDLDEDRWIDQLVYLATDCD